MPCGAIVSSKCEKGHALSWRCRDLRPQSCRTCENEKKAKERKLQQDHARQKKREQESQEHAEHMAKVEDQLRIMREKAEDGRRSRDMAQTLEQKKRDLEDAERLAGPPPIDIKATATCHVNPYTSPDMPITSSQPAQSSLNGPTTLQSESKPLRSPSEAAWERQKQVDNASSDSIDSLMRMTGLEEVKTQFLKIKARIETAQRQGTDMKDERFGIVLLGNPGTGMI